MNEAELVAAFQGYLGLTYQVLFGYVSLISGFLVMCYLVADKISSFLASISIVLFSVVSALLVFGIFLSRNDSGKLMEHMRLQSQAGALDLPWLGSNPPWAADVSSVLFLVATIGGYLACIAYFFYQRRAGAQDDA